MKNKNLLNSNSLVPVILGSGINALGLIRSFAKYKIKSIVVDHVKSYAFYSKYSYGELLANPITNTEKFIDDLVDFGKKLKSKGFLIPTNDEWLLPISRNQKKLEEYYYFPMSENDVIEVCSDKEKLYDFAEKYDIPHPKTFFINNIEETAQILTEIIYPCILKPTITVGFANKLKTKARVFRLETEEELLKMIDKIKNADLSNIPYVIQEFIPGDVETLYTITSYSNKSAEIIAYSTGHKMRQNPPDAGTIVSGKVIHTPELIDYADKLINNIGFYGIANTEFKKDTRDGKFKLIEINPRPGKWNYSVTASGINMPYIAYQEALGKKYDKIEPSKKQLIWFDFISDFMFSLFYFKKKGYNNFSLTFKQWRKSVKGKKAFAICSFKDPRPSLKYILFLLRKNK